MSQLPQTEPNHKATVLKSGLIYVGRQHAGKKVEVYFLKESEDTISRRRREGEN